MARCKEELRAQGVTALPRTCPEHGIKGCPGADMPIAPPVEGAGVYIAEETRSQHLFEGVRVWAVMWDDLKGHWRNWTWVNSAWALHSSTRPPDYFHSHSAGYSWVDVEKATPPLTVLPDPPWQRDESQPVLTPKKNGLQPALPMAFGELRKLVRELDERGVPDSAKITVKGPEGEIFTGEFCDLRLQWWTVVES